MQEIDITSCRDCVYYDDCDKLTREIENWEENEMYSSTSELVEHVEYYMPDECDKYKEKE